MVIHKAPSQAARILHFARFCYQGDISMAIIIAEEYRQPAIAPLRHMVRDIRDNYAGETGHDGLCSITVDSSLISIVSPEFSIISIVSPEFNA